MGNLLGKELHRRKEVRLAGANSNNLHEFPALELTHYRDHEYPDIKAYYDAASDLDKRFVCAVLVDDEDAIRACETAYAK